MIKEQTIFLFSYKAEGGSDLKVNFEDFSQHFHVCPLRFLVTEYMTVGN